MRKIYLSLFTLLLFFTANAQYNDSYIAKQLVVKNAGAIGFSNNDLGNYIVSSSYFNETSGTQMVYLTQAYKGLPVFNQMLVLAFKDGNLISKAGGFLADIEKLTNGAAATASVTPADAVRTSISDAKVPVPSAISVVNTLESGKKYDFGKLNIAAENITAELMWVPIDEGKDITAVKLAWQVQLFLNKNADYLQVRVDARNNTIVNKSNLTVSENFDQFNRVNLPGFMKMGNAEQQKTFGKSSSGIAENAPSVSSPSLVGTANYTVIPYPAESPIHPGGTAAVRTNPWTLAGGNAVSLGWHNDGVTDYTTSRGNNVWAQEDRDNSNATFGIMATSTTTPDPLNFTYAGQPDYTVAPTTANFQQFALTNLFYWNNLVHDLTYNHGFTEPAGNFQNDNQGRGGSGADYVIADGQDAGGLNNANMATPPDGSRPRMQMYLWDPVRSVTTLNVNSPGTIAGPYNAVEGAFSTANLLATVGPKTGQVVWYNDDAAGNTHYACGAPVPANSVSGKIALISRGFGGAVCTATVPFTTKVKNAQDAGAIAVIMVNNVAGAPIVMGGGPDNTIIIPAVMISDVDGATIAAQLTNNVNATLSGTAAGTIQLDGDIDNGIIAHEFFHGVSNRLTGGPATTSCLGNSEQAGEGWSDYMALMITTNWATATVNDGFNIKRPIGNYAFGYPTTGPGIRTHPYSTNLAVNPLTYSDLPTSVIPHGVGTVFCTALWEMTWEIIKTRGISANIFNSSQTGGNVVAFRIMMEGLKLQPCSPGFLDARNAIIQADKNLYGGADTCAIWRAFAKRGMGFGAVQGSASNNNDQTASFTVPPACNATTTAPTVTINQAAAQVDPATTSPINFTVVFDQAVTGFATGDVTLSGTAGATTATVTGGPTTYNVAVTGMTTCGTVIATIPAGVCQNAAAQTNVASTSTDNTVTFAAAAPTVTINQAAAQADPTSATPIVFTAVFDQPVTGFTGTDVTLSGTAGATTAAVSGGPSTYTINVTGMTGSGTVIATIAAGVAQGLCAQNNVASTSTDNSVTYNAPVTCTSVNPVANQTYCNGATTAAINFSSPTAGTTFSWVNNTTSIGLGASGNGNIPSFVATNATAAPVTATIIVTPTLTLVTPTTTTFNFTGAAQTFTVPAGVTSINFTALGAQGGSGATGTNNGGTVAGGAGGLGSRATGTLAVTPGQVLNIFVGGAGGTPTAGFNGGGAGGNANSGGGGGASDVRFPGATTADRILTAAGGGGGGRGGCEGIIGAPGAGGAGGNGDGNGSNGANSVTAGGVAGGGFGAIGTNFGAAGIGCAGFLGAPGLAGTGATGGNGGAGQTCCCFSFQSVPGGGGGGGGQLGGGGGGGGSAGTTGCSGNDKGAGGGGAGGTSYTGGVTAGVITTNIQTGDGQVVLNYNIVTTCTGPTIGFTITVNPTPAVNAIPNQVVCQNAPTAPVNFAGTPAGVVFQWTNNTPAIGLAAAGTGNIPSFIAQNPGNTPLVATITVTPVTGLATPVTTTFAFTGAVQTYTVPAGVTSINIKTWGAQGNSSASGALGGLGGYAEGNLAVTPGQILNVTVGGGGTSTLNGGFNGGGAAGANAGCATARGGGGGGASDVRIAPYALANRVIVGAGGGGAGGDRVAGCGRGTGGGGGGGLYGGGGGSAWIGAVAGWTLATGGTQAAGGAGGTSTFATVPGNNGSAGVLAIGGAGGVEVNSNQAGNATGPVGGVGGGLTGTGGNHPGIGNFVGASGAGGSSYIGGVTGGLTTAGLRSGNGQVQITYTPTSAATCFGTARTFTITVNPNANLIIVADPGTTLCEGDPTLLTVFDAGAVSAPGALYTQGPATPVNGSPSQVFEPANVAFNSQSADDFVIPNGGNWNITGITANGIGTGSPTSVNVFFYTNSGSNLPGAAIASFTNITTFTRTGANYSVTLPSAVALGAGRYWMSFQVNMSFAAGGQWFWGNYGAPVVGNPYAWQNPGGGFATPCAGWGYGGTGCNVGGGAANVNNIFSIVGTSVGLGPQSTGTFLWSPAAGLSSTTSNPVAASPQNTTTYTVTRTTVPGGCVASAQVTITVNKRPVVTTQPVSRVNCSGTSASFTVGATGTALTYQWQVSTAGCAGPWVNLTNVAPYSNVTTATLGINPVNTSMSGYAYRCVVSGICAPWTPPTNVSNCATLTVNPLPNLVVTPPVSCGGVAGISGTALTVTQLPPPVPGSVTVNSGAINVSIPDGTNAAATSNLTVAGIPANATVTDVRINMNINHTWVGDVDVNIKAPNAAVLNLVAGLDNGAGGNATDNFTNTTFNSLGGSTISGFAAPRTGIFTAEARAGRGPVGFLQTVAAWSGLYSTPNGVWTLAMGDRVATDIGALTNWSITINYTTPGTGPLPTLSYVWTPNTTVAAGLYTNTTATTLYTGTNLATVYAAPPAQTTYTVTATNTATGCINTATALVNYTPPAPTVTPNPVAMCLGDAAVKLKSSSSSSGSVTFNSGTLALAIPDGPATWPQTSFPGVSTPNLAVSGIPAGATITGMSVKLNLTHTYIADMVIVLKAPNGNVFNLDAVINRTGGPGANFVNTVISSAGTTALSAGAPPYTGTFAPDAAGATFVAAGFTFPGGPTSPAGYIPTVSNFSGLYSVPNGNYTLGIYDWGAGDLGTLTNWELTVNYVLGVPASPAVWTPNGPGSGLFSDAAASVVYNGAPQDSVWARPTPAGVYTYQVVVNNLITTTATPTTPMAGGNGNNLVTFNVKNNNTFPVTLSSISSNTFGSGAVTSTVYYKTTGNAGNPGAISAANGFVQFGSAPSTVTAGAMNVLVSGTTLQIPAGATYAIVIDMAGATFPAYTNGTGTVATYSNGGVDIITDGNVGWGGPNAPAAPVNNPRNFNGSITFLGSGPGTCTSPARTVTVTVNQPTTLNAALPVDQTVCTDKVATFTASASGSGPFSYQWQVSTDFGNTFTNISNGGVYSGVNTATLTVTAPPVSMSGYQYRVTVTGAAPCASVISRKAILTVNPLPVITISPLSSSLFPGMAATLSSTVTPSAAATYTWIRDGVTLTSGSLGVLSGIGTGTLRVDVDGMGLYTLRVTDVNGCTNTSNSAVVKDSASGRCFIYPNPTSGQFQVRYYSIAGNNNLPRGIVVYDAKGDRVFTQNYTVGRPYDRMDVDMRAYGKGLYWVEIVDRNGNRLSMCRVVIQ